MKRRNPPFFNDFQRVWVFKSHLPHLTLGKPCKSQIYRVFSFTCFFPSGSGTVIQTEVPFHRRQHILKEKGLIMSLETLVPVTGTIMNIARGNDCCSQMSALRTANGIVNFAIDSNTLVIDSRQLRTGMRVTAFYDSSLPVPLIFPPQYRAQIVTVTGRNEQVTLKHFNRSLSASDRSLQLNIADSTMVQTVNGQPFDCSPGNQFLLVYYSATTRSIPPQASPGRIIVFC